MCNTLHSFHTLPHPSLIPHAFSYVVSLGFIIVLCLTIPMGYFNLDDNIWVQKGAAAAAACCCCRRCRCRRATAGAFIMLLLCLITWIGQATTPNNNSLNP